MAGPTYGATGTRLSGASDTTASLAVPAGVASGSVVVAFLARDTSLGAYEAFTSLPSGFALVPDNPGFTVDSSGGQNMDVAWKRASGADSGTYDFAWTTSMFRAGFVARIDGCVATGNPFAPDDGAVNVGTSTSTPSVSVTTVAADRLLVWCGSSWTSGTWTAPAGFTPQVTDVAFDLLYLATAAQASPGSSGSIVGTQAGFAHAAWVGAFAADADQAPPRRAVVGPGLAATQRASW